MVMMSLMMVLMVMMAMALKMMIQNGDDENHDGR